MGLRRSEKTLLWPGIGLCILAGTVVGVQKKRSVEACGIFSLIERRKIPLEKILFYF